MSAGAVPAVHPERTADAACLHWRVADGPARPGWPGHLARAFDRLTGDGSVAAVTPTAEGALVTVAPGQGWPALAASVRDAVQDAVRAAFAPAPGVDRNAALEAAAQDAVAGVARYAAGHGGGVELVEVCGDMVRVRLHGACHGCPAAALTVHGRLEAALAARAPWCAGVELVDQPRRWLSRTA
jgi:Fe-S cluster biogenesis protein NfuA